jgi:hypothetical protein
MAARTTIRPTLQCHANSPQVQILSLFGKVEYDPEYEYKRIRARW